ncbi:TetR/AcrR family transcriptional regulator [Rhodococcus sp. CH91]|uniref:TetR/AcrR family transcriptional regulator n=1 Tax=Rhodococcus sp. CH91 TaxID=2910256 RepID=UPI0027DEE473|nr:TetR/AcrR family transcriptional regulator [Rhodococcus sp. CH91]
MNEEIRTRIVEAADALFYSRGFGQVGMDAVRDAAGVSLRALYKEFPSKDELIAAVLAGRHEMWTRGVEAKVDAIDDPAARLLAVYDFLSDWFGDPDFRGCGFINAFGELGSANPRVAEVVREHKADFQHYVARLVAEAGAPESLAPSSPSSPKAPRPPRPSQALPMLRHRRGPQRKFSSTPHWAGKRGR